MNLLRNNGFDAVSATDGYAGVELAKVFRPDLILSNIGLPRLRGDAVYTELRNDAATATIPFIFVTGQGTSAEINRLRQLGAQYYLCKPYTSEALLQAIAKILG